ncbi:MAG: glycoside hydrolase family 15 protein [Bacillota bacterium]|nr:glycoside hydrolase family 15 protein [Bacillota bacterium]
MPRSAVMGNGSILVNFLPGPVMKEVYYPLPGMKLTTGAHGHALYLWCDGGMCRAGDGTLRAESSYTSDTLVLETLCRCEALGMEVRVTDAVHFSRDVIARKVRVRNTLDHSRRARVYMALDTAFLANDVGDTAMLDPHSGGIIHFKESTYMLANASGSGGSRCLKTTGKRSSLREMPHPPVRPDGALGEIPVSQGAVYSVMGVEVDVAPASSSVGYFWLSFGSSLQAVRHLDAWVKQEGVERLIKETGDHWRRWLESAPVPESDLPREAAALFKRSLLTCGALCAGNGAVLAATDQDMLVEGHDHYSYVWPRDGALVTKALLRAGIAEPARRFLEFCARAVGDEGFLWQRYHPDGSLGSSWHSWSGGPLVLPPIQEDETALPIWLLGHYVEATGDLSLLRSCGDHYFRMADFLASYIHRPSSLPFPSRDVWEERYGIFTFTVASVAAGLQAAAKLGTLCGKDADSQRYLALRSAMVAAWEQLLFDAPRERFARGLYIHAGEFGLDLTLDSSLFGIRSLGLLPADDKRALSTLSAVEKRLWVDTTVGGLARYEGDHYFRRSDDVGRIPGNPWAVCTLWAASARAETALLGCRAQGRGCSSEQDLERSRDLMMWALSRASPAGMLAEQFDPFTGEELSVSPLTWSHAAYVDAFLDYASAWSAVQSR